MQLLKPFKQAFTTVLLLASISTFAQDVEPIIAYSFENQQPTDDSSKYLGSLYGNAAIVQMADGSNLGESQNRLSPNYYLLSLKRRILTAY